MTVVFLVNSKVRFFVNQISGLRKKIYNIDDHVLFDEALKALSTKAYRASYIVIWVGIAESLRSKIAELSQKDSEAGRVYGEIQRCEQQNLSPDKLILDKSHELGLLDTDEHKKIDHIRGMRNSYAHPTGVAPLPEEVYAAFNVSVEYVLSKPSLLKHGYVTSLLKSIFENIHFLDDDEGKVTEYAKNIANKLHPEVLPFLMKKACENFESCTEVLMRRRGVQFVSAILEEVEPDFDQDEWGIINIISQHSRAASLILSTSALWPYLPTQAKDMCFGNLIEPLNSDGSISLPTSSRIRKTFILEKADLLTDSQMKRFNTVLGKVPYKESVLAQIPISRIAPRIINDLRSYNWYTQNPAADALLNIGLDKLSILPDADQVEIGRNILQAAQGSSGSSITLINKIVTEQVLDKIVLGLALECLVNEKNEFRLKEKFFDDALLIVVNQENPKIILNEVVTAVDLSHDGVLTSEGDYDSAISIIDKVIDSGVVNASLLQNLRQSVASAKDRLTK